MIPDNEADFLGNASVMVEDVSKLSFNKDSNKDGKIDSGHIVVELKDDCANEKEVYRNSRTIQMDEISLSKPAMVSQGTDPMAIDYLQMNGGTTNEKGNCENGSKEGSLNESPNLKPCSNVTSITTGNSSSIQRNIKRLNSMITDNESRRYFPPYGVNETVEKAKVMVTRDIQVYDWELPKPKQRKRSGHMVVFEKPAPSTFTKFSIPSTSSDSRRTESFLVKECTPTVPCYKPMDILPQNILFSPFEYLQQRQPKEKLERAIVKKEGIKFVPALPSTSATAVNRPIAKGTKSHNFQFPLPTFPTKRLPPECARHKPFGFRKSRNWFSFYSHPCRSEIALVKNRLHDLDEIPRLRFQTVACKQDSLKYEFLRKFPVAIRTGKSRIHGVGVFADEEIAAGQFIVEYKGEVIRNELVERREDMYRNKGLGIYMFNMDRRYTVDGTLKGSVARFINHSCEPNCSAKVIKCEAKKKHIILYAEKRISKGDELSYDYKMPREKEKIPCLCSSRNCRKFLN